MTNTVWVLAGDSGRACSGSPAAACVDHQGRRVISFDAVNDQEWEWDGLVAPPWLVLPMVAIPRFTMAIAQAGQVRVEIGLEAIDYATEKLDLAHERFAYSSAGQAVPASAGHPGQFKPIRLTRADIGPGDGVRIRFRRDADQSTGVDSAAGDLRLVSLEICDSS